MAINALLVQSMLMIDTVLVAPLGEFSVAAIGIATALIAFAIGIELAISNGIQMIVARAYGARSKADLALAFWVGLFINLSSGIVFFCVLVFFDTQIVAGLSSVLEINSNALAYIDIAKYLILLTAITQVCTAFYNGRGNTKIVLKGFLVEVPINAVLSYFLIYGAGSFAGLGLEGAAIGSVVAVLLRTAYFIFCLKLDASIDLRYPQNRPISREVGPQFFEISPIAANFFVLFIGASVYQLLYAQLDLSSFVAITLIFPWLRIGTQFVSAWANATAINISQAIGNKDTAHLDAFVAICLRTGLVLSFVAALLFFILSQCVHLIYPDIAADTYAAMTIIAPLYVFLPIIRGYNSVSGNVLRALGESKRVLKLHLVTQWAISLPLCAVLILFFEASIFWAFAIMPLEEILKTYHFKKYIRDKLSEYDASRGQTVQV